jgi:crossover junction endodeoxyribonuclease RuvC
MVKELVLGVDPSLSCSGWAFINYDKDKAEKLVNTDGDKTLFNADNSYKPELIDYGDIPTDSNNKLTERVYKVYQEIERVIKFYKPDVVASEDQFAGRNFDTLKKLSHVRGQIMTLSRIYNIPFYLFSPKTVKKIFTGSGNASKSDMVETANKYYNIEILKSKNDTADAIGVGMSYIINKTKGALI